MKILATGLPGSGKTTQAKLLAQDLGLCFVKTGEILRELAAQDNEQGRSIKVTLDQGELVDDAAVAAVVKAELLKPSCQSGFVMDGYPRSLNQLSVYDPGFDQVIYLKISERVARQRLLERGRHDDTTEVINNRLKVQQQTLSELIDYFRSKQKLVEIDGEQPVEVVTSQILDQLR